MIIFITIFFVTLMVAIGMLFFRAWEVKTSQVIVEDESRNSLPELSFRRIEKILLFLTKHILQSIVLFSVKTWFTIITKARIWIRNKLPKINQILKKKIKSDTKKISFVQRAIIESKIKIKRVKENIKNEHEGKIIPEENI